jgi:hypothetical protein
LTQPFFTIIGLLFAESKVNELPVARLCRGKGNHVFGHMTKVVASVSIVTRSKTLLRREYGCSSSAFLTDLVVFRIPLVRIRSFEQPFLVFRQGKEITTLLPFRDLKGLSAVET